MEIEKSAFMLAALLAFFGIVILYPICRAIYVRTKSAAKTISQHTSNTLSDVKVKLEDVNHSKKMKQMDIAANRAKNLLETGVFTQEEFDAEIRKIKRDYKQFM